MKRIIFVTVILSITFIAVYLWKNRSNNNKEEKSQENKTATAKIGSIVSKVSATGLVSANLTVEIKCKASGEIIYLPFDIGDEVKKGDILFKIDPVYEKQRVERTKVELQSAQARLVQAKQNLRIAEKTLEINRRKAEAAITSTSVKLKDARAKADRLKQLIEKNLVSQEEYDSAETLYAQLQADLETAKATLEALKIDELTLELRKEDIKLAEAQVATANIELSDAQQRLRDTVVSAPIDGLVTEKYVQIGQIISSGITTVGGGTSILQISDLSHIFVIASIDESSIGKVKKGQTAEITADAYPEVKFSGEVVQVAPKGKIEANVVTFDVKLEVTSPNKMLLKPNMTTNIDITVGQSNNTIIIPVEAVIRKGMKKFVVVEKPDGSVEEKEIQTGIDDNTNIEVIGGLENGEIVQIGEKAKSIWRKAREEKKRRVRVGIH